MSTLNVSVSGVRNRTHAMYVAAWLRSHLESNTDSIALVDLDSESSDRFDLGESMNSLGPHIDMVEHHGAQAVKHTYLAIGAPGLKHYTKLRSCDFAMRTVVVGEGLGSYGSWVTRRLGMRREGNREPWATVRATAVTAAKRFLAHEYWNMYERVGSGWTTNEAIAEEFRAHHGAVEETDLIVYLDQPWARLGVVELGEHLAHLTTLSEAVQSTGFKFAVRPHPAQADLQYAGLEVVRGTTPAELDKRIVESRLVLGATSTALLNMKSIFGKESLRVVGPWSTVPGLNLSAHQEALFEAYLPPPVSIADVATFLRGGQRPA